MPLPSAQTSSMADSLFKVEVAFALPHKQRIVALTVPEGTTARQAVGMADLPSLFQEVPSDTFTQAPLGIFGKASPYIDHKHMFSGFFWQLFNKSFYK